MVYFCMFAVSTLTKDMVIIVCKSVKLKYMLCTEIFVICDNCIINQKYLESYLKQGSAILSLKVIIGIIK